MTYHTPKSAQVSAASTASTTDKQANGHRLDRDKLLQAIVTRRQRLADLEAALIDACEAEAFREADHSSRRDDRGTWNKATWNRYLAAATRLEPDFGPKMRRLLQDIDQLTRLSDISMRMTLAA